MFPRINRSKAKVNTTHSPAVSEVVSSVSDNSDSVHHSLPFPLLYFAVLQVLYILLLCEAIYSTLPHAFFNLIVLYSSVIQVYLETRFPLYVKVGSFLRRGRKLFCSPKRPNQMEPNQPPIKVVPGVLSPVVWG